MMRRTAILQAFTVLLFCITFCNTRAQTKFTSSQTGDWNIGTTWGGACAGSCTAGVDYPNTNDTAIIQSGHTVTLKTATARCYNLIVSGMIDKNGIGFAIGGNTTVNSGGTISGNGTVQFSGNVTNNTGGTISSTGQVIFAGADKQISGGGTYLFTSALTLNFTNNTTIASDVVDFTRNNSAGSLNITAGKTVTNNGVVTLIGGSINNTAATWTNNASTSTLSVESAIGASITLNASANGNTVIYSSSSSYTIKTPSGAPGTYHHLKVKGGGTKTLPAALAINGNLDIANGTTLNCASKDITLNGNWLLNTSGAITNNTSNTCTFNGTTTLSGTNTFSFNNITINSAKTLTAPSAATFTITGDFSNNSGTFNANSGTANFTASSGTQTLKSGGNSFNNITHSGAGVLQLNTNALTTGGTFTNAPGAGNFDANDLAHTVTGLATLSSGTYLAKTSTQTFNGGITVSGGTFTGSSGQVDATDVTLNNGTFTAPSGAFNVSGDWSRSTAIFTPGANTVTFTKGSGTQNLNSGGASFNNISHSGAGTLKLITNDLTVGGALTNSSGIFDANAKENTVTGLTTVSGGTYIAKTNTQRLNGGITVNGGDFTGSSSGTVQVQGVVTISNGTLTAPGSFGAFTVSGNWVFNGGSFIHNSGTITFDNSTTVSGSSTSSFNKVTITGTLTGHATNINIASDFTNNNNFIHNSGKVTFNGTTTIGGSQPTSFNHVTISGTLTAPASANMNVAGDFQNDGTFNHNSGTVTFNGTSTLSGSSTTSFNHVTISGGTLTAPSSANMNVAGDFTNAGTFTHNSGTVTFNGTTTISGSSTTSFNHVIISSTLTSKSAGIVNVKGDFTDNGTFNHNSGTLTFNGTSAQTIGGTAPKIALYNLTVSNAAGVTTNVPLDIDTTGTVTVSAGTFATGTNAITLPSTAGGTARIGNSAGSITGTNWIIQRHIPASAIGWNDVSSTIGGNLISDWDNELYMSIGNSCPDGMAGGWSSVYYWNTATQAWVAVSNCAQALSAARGYEIWLASTYSTLSETTMDSRGTPNFGNKVATLASGIGNWALIGNPYASGIDWASVYGDATGLTNIIQVYDETLSDYAVWDGDDIFACTGQLAGSGGILSAHQGFWVQNSGASPTLTFKESHKSATNRPLVRQINPDNILKMKLYSEGRKNACESVIKIRDDASEYFDPNTDFGYLKSRDSLTPSFTPVTADNRKVRVKAIPVKSFLSVPVTASFGAAGEYKIDFSGADAIYKYNRIMLEDVEEGILFPVLSSDENILRAHKTYSFSQGAGASKKASGSGEWAKERKFILHFSNVKQVNNLSSSIIEYMVQVFPVEEGVMIHFNFDEPTNSAISIYNVLGQDVLTRNVSVEQESITLPIEKKNQLYFVKITTDEGATVKKIFH